jgi:C4-dicarboxylate-specific signal transduction histidine kinase
MPDEGKVKISIASVDEKIIVTLEVTDLEIPKNIKRKNFDPFFTTKTQRQE